ncbi:MAG: hypothetical protein KTR27_00985 [Leptolyngbyaceae cyanobacterium MAG.088]|nr:hypothetical protein [Leptolyngbyaceae cyanobacterium MAG.088]
MGQCSGASTKPKRQAALDSLRQRYGQRIKSSSEAMSSLGDSKLGLLLADQQTIAANQTEPSSADSQPNSTALKDKVLGSNRSKKQGHSQGPGLIPANFLDDIKQWAGSAEIDLSGVDDEQLEKRYAELTYYSKWLITIYKEVQKEVFLLKKQLQDSDSHS